VFVLPKRLVRNAGPAVLAATAWVLAGDSFHMAAAQGRLDAEYVVTIAGIPIGHSNWVIEIGGDQFTTAASGTTTGLLRLFTGIRGAGTSRGVINGGQPIPTSYAATINYGHKVDDVHMALAGGNVKNYTVEPPVPPHPQRVPVTEADRRGVLDPLTTTLTRVGGSGDPVSPQACARKAAVFDGRLRYDLRSEFKRIEMVKAERGYEGPAVVCAIYFTPVAGYVPDRPIIKYLVAERDAEIWLAPISGTRVLVPFRFTIPTPIGFGTLQATQFVSVVQPARSSASAKTQ